jgi:hypothetical protein
MDVRDTHSVLSEAVERVRSERSPVLIEAITYRFRGHSMADPEDYRTKEEVAAWRERDPVQVFGRTLIGEGALTDEELEGIDAEAMARVDEAVAFAEASPFPTPESLYDDIYVLRDGSRGWYSVQTSDEAAAGSTPAELEGASDDEIPQQLTSALAAGEDGREAGEMSSPGLPESGA